MHARRPKLGGGLGAATASARGRPRRPPASRPPSSQGAPRRARARGHVAVVCCFLPAEAKGQLWTAKRPASPLPPAAPSLPCPPPPVPGPGPGTLAHQLAWWARLKAGPRECHGGRPGSERRSRRRRYVRPPGSGTRAEPRWAGVLAGGPSRLGEDKALPGSDCLCVRPIQFSPPPSLPIVIIPCSLLLSAVQMYLPVNFRVSSTLQGCLKCQAYLWRWRALSAEAGLVSYG